MSDTEDLDADRNDCRHAVEGPCPLCDSELFNDQLAQLPPMTHVPNPLLWPSNPLLPDVPQQRSRGWHIVTDDDGKQWLVVDYVLSPSVGQQAAAHQRGDSQPVWQHAEVDEHGCVCAAGGPFPSVCPVHYQHKPMLAQVNMPENPAPWVPQVVWDTALAPDTEPLASSQPDVHHLQAKGSMLLQVATPGATVTITSAGRTNTYLIKHVDRDAGTITMDAHPLPLGWTALTGITDAAVESIHDHVHQED